MDSIFNNIMTPLGMVVWSHGPAVISALLGAIILCIFGLMLISFHSPKDAVANEVGNVERIEGVLRQILSEQNWPSVKTPEVVTETATAAPTAEQPAPAETPAAPVSESATEEVAAAPAPEAAAVSPAAVAPASAEPSAPAPSAEELDQMQNKIKELEEKLAEYSVIEEDIADLSKFRQENDELKKKISHATGVPAEQAASMPWDDFEKIVQEKGATSAKETVSTSIEKTE